MCALDFGFGQRAVGGAHSTNNPGLIPASAVYVYTCTRSWGTRTQARMASYRYTRTGTRVESGQTDESPRMCVFICTYMCVYIYIVCIHTYIYISNGQKYLVRLFIRGRRRPLNFSKLFVSSLSVSLLD